MENPIVNLVAIVGFLIVAIGTIPMILFAGTHKDEAGSSKGKQG